MKTLRPIQSGLVASMLFASLAPADDHDVVVYGGTCSAVIAAVQAKKMGRSVVIVSPDKHLGGLSSGGLGFTDTGNKAVIGGLSREFYHRVWKHYDKPGAWRQQKREEYGNKGQGTVAMDGEQRTMWIFEPHVAEQVFEDFIKEYQIRVDRDEWLDRARGVKMEGGRIASISTLGGKIYTGRMFIDATYEGDLMAAAKVDYHVGREANSVYGEKWNGVQVGVLHHKHHFGAIKERISPYVVPGDPKSGVLPRISTAPPGEYGEGDKRVQAYCFRMCLTDDPSNRIPFPKPEGYDPRQYELLLRVFQAGWRETFGKFDPIPNHKTDTNNHGPFSTDNIGFNYGYPDGSYEERRAIIKEHETYQKGWLWFIANDPRVPKDVREEMRKWGLPKDEFADNGNWSRQLYVREARRMIGSYVMTENDLLKKRPTPDSVGMGSYGIDSHNVQRYITPDGLVQNEGDIGVPTKGPYEIAYGSLVPRKGQCDNLLVPVCVSSSHIAFGSIRMEPVFMILGQSAATAAVMAIEAGGTVQDVPYKKLRERLLKDGQVLETPASVKSAANKGGMDPATLPGVVVDDGDAKLAGDWGESRAAKSFVGDGYRHDGNTRDGQCRARFEAKLPKSGRYEVRLAAPHNNNRASNVRVEIEHAKGVQSMTVDEKPSPVIDGLFIPLGTFDFDADKPAVVTVSNKDANGYVVIDAVQFVPVEIAQAERAAKRAAAFTAVAASQSGAVRKGPAEFAGSPIDPEAAARAKAEPVRLAMGAKPAEVDGRSYDLIVVGGTAGGVACAVRAARDGAGVLLVQHNDHVGGMMTNGLMQWDALYGGHRAPLFTELLGNIEKYYRTVYGENSPDHRVARFTQEHYPMGWAEPHVAEREFNRLLSAERRIALLLRHYPASVRREGALMQSVTLREYGGGKEVTVRGKVFVDATYEGDLFALAKVPYRCGREAREEFDEPHAGVVFTNIDKGPAPRDAVDGRLNIHPYSSRQGSIDPASPFTADRSVQAYNYRFCVTKDPANRVMVAAPPPGYDREEYVHYDRKSIATNPGPNQKSHMNSPILPGENHDYPEAGWPAREKIIERHKNFALGLIWFLQNDESVPRSKRDAFRQWGLPKDEFADHDHIPYEMYVREARRIVGRHVYSERDNSLAPGFARTPVHPDSVAITDWYMDSHSCTRNSRPGYRYDGKLILTEESRPGQIPYRSLLPQGVDNLLVPVCLSATHIAWGAVRLEPVWMETGEAAGVAAALSLKLRTTPAQLSPDRLVRELCERRFMVSFFNDVNVDGAESWIPAVEYFGTRGFFPSYDANATDLLDSATARLWAGAFVALAKEEKKRFNPDALAAELMKVGADGKTITARQFMNSMEMPVLGLDRGISPYLKIDSEAPITRGDACRLMFERIQRLEIRRASNSELETSGGDKSQPKQSPGKR